MINNSTEIVFLVKGKGLAEAVLQAFEATSLLEQEYCAINTPRVRYAPFAEIADQIKLHPELLSSPDVLIQKLYFYAHVRYVVGGHLRSDVEDLRELGDYLLGKRRKQEGGAVPYQQRWLRLALIALWSERVVLLPATVNLIGKVPENVANSLFSEVARSLWAKGSKGEEAGPQGFVRTQGLRFCLSTDWHSRSALNWEEIGQHHIIFLPDYPGHLKIAMLGKWNIRKIIGHLVSEFGGGLGFEPDRLGNYDRWIASGDFKTWKFEYYEKNIEEIARSRRLEYKKKSSIAFRKKLLHNKNRASQLFGDSLPENIDYRLPVGHIVLQELAKQDDPEAYFLALATKRKGAAALDRVYPGRQLPKEAGVWFRLADAFLAQRKANGLETEEGPRAALVLLEDYLFCYLPWWNELNKAQAVPIPRTPAGFSRRSYCLGKWDNRTTSPRGLYDMLKLRRKSEGSYANALQMIRLFFDYVAACRDDFPDFAIPQFEIPIHLSVDIGKKIKPTKTTKAVFPKAIIPLLIRYFYAAESFGLILQNKCVEGNLEWSNWNTTLSGWINVPQFAPKFGVDHHSRFIPIDNFPTRLFGMARRSRLWQMPHAETKRIWLPHLSALRLCGIILETGLRAQSVQWLDIDSFDSLNHGSEAGQSVYDLLINTDKTKDKPWSTPIHERVRSVLKREELFQRSCCENFMSVRVPYEGRSSSRFSDIKLLMRSSGSAGQPIYDSVYFETWNALLLGFQRWYNASGFGDTINLVKYRRAEVDSTFYSASKFEYSPVRLASDFTPHSARASFISNRQGILATGDLAELVGHANLATTMYYTIENYDELRNKVALAATSLWDWDKTSPVHIRADTVTSSLRRSFAKNSIGTREAYGFVSISLANINNDELGIDRLRTTSAGEIIFRETHICPVGEVCPNEVMDLIIERRRCGLCPLAVKCVDHVTAIAAKRHRLIEQIQVATNLLEHMRHRGEPEASCTEIEDGRRLNALEAMGWEKALMVLTESIKSLETSSSQSVTVDQPDAVKLHLRLVAKPTTEREFLLHRLEDSLVNPILHSPETFALHRQLGQRLAAGRGMREAAEMFPNTSHAQAVLSSLRVVIESLGHDAIMLRVVDVLDEIGRQAPALIGSTTLG